MEDDGNWTMDEIREEDIDQVAVYRVLDRPLDEDEDERCNRAEASLPRNLTLKTSKATPNVSTLSTIVLCLEESA